MTDSERATIHRRSVGVRNWRWRDLPFLLLALIVAYLANAIDANRGDADAN